MPLLSSCCCWYELKKGSQASAIYAILASLGQCGTAGYALFRSYELAQEIPELQFYNHFPLGCFVYFWMGLIWAGVNVLLSILLLIGIDRGYNGRYFIFLWLIGFATLRFVIVVGVIAYLIWLDHRIYDVMYMNNATVLGLVYGIVETIVAITAIICVYSYYQECDDKVNGKSRRTKFALWMFDREMSVQSNPSVSGSRRTSHGSNYLLN